MIERTLPILATRKATAVRVDAFRAVPLTIGISIPDEIGSLAGATILRAEIRSSRVDLSATALAGTSIELPIGQSFELTFTSAQMNQSLAGEESAQFWLVVYATYPPGAVSGSVDLELDVFASIDLVLHEHAASLTAPSPPNAAIALTKTQADLLYMPIGGGTPGTGTVTSVAVNTANGVSAVVTNPSSNVAMTFTLGAITPTSVAATGAVSGSSLSTAGNVSGTWAGTAIALAKGGTGATTASGARTALELGTMATQDAASYLISDWAGSANIATVGTVTTGTWSASTIALAKGGTGATTAAGARTALELGSLAQLSAAPAGTLTGSTLAAGVTASSLTSASGGSFGTGAYAAAFDPASPGPIGATTASTVRATNFTSTTGVNSFGNTNFQDLSVFNLLGSSKANLQSALTLGAFDDATHKGVILTGVLTITSSGSTPVFTYASGAAAIHRTALGLGTLATVSPTGTKDATTYLRGDDTYATNLAVTTETTTARTLSLVDNNNYIRCTNTLPTTITIPLQATVTWPPAATITFRRATGAGAVTLAGVSGVTVAGNTASSIAAEGVFAIVRTGENTWDFV